MTDQTPIPVPGDTSGKRPSLLERAAKIAGVSDQFRPAPVPAELPEALGRRSRAESRAELPVEEVNAGTEGSALGRQPVAARRIAFRAAPQKIDRKRLADMGLVIPDGQASALFEEFRIVKREILNTMRASAGAEKSMRLLVSSPLPGEGKTFCATNLALAMAAEKQCEVVLVDADFAKPSIVTLLGLEGRQGLMDALSDPDVRIEDCVITTDIPGFNVLPAGSRTSSDSEFIASARAEAVLSRLTQGAPNRVIIFDSPPALAASPAAELAKHAGQAIVVCRADRTGQSALEDALSLLSTCPEIRLLLNGANFSPSGRRFGAYYGTVGEAE